MTIHTDLGEFDTEEDYAVAKKVEDTINDTVHRARVLEGLAASPEYATVLRRRALARRALDEVESQAEWEDG